MGNFIKLRFLNQIIIIIIRAFRHLDILSRVLSMDSLPYRAKIPVVHSCTNVYKITYCVMQIRIVILKQ